MFEGDEDYIKMRDEGEGKEGGREKGRENWIELSFKYPVHLTVMTKKSSTAG